KHYRIIDFLLVFSVISTFVKCSKCDGKIQFKSCRKEGFGFNIQVKCEHCKMPVYIPSSEKIGRMYEVNYSFNEGYIALLAFLEEMKISVGPSAHEYVKTFDESRILKAEEKAALQRKEARILRRMEQKDALDLANAAGTLLYGAGIDDSM
ncbi:hypothetical protein ALC60_14492, partial [Trachymyrmex zeteki]